MKTIFRFIFLKGLKLTKFNFKITHHLTGYKFLLNSYTHKGYWYYGRNREKNTISEFKRLIKKGDTVIEVGGHIGYFTTYFSSLVTDNGNVHVFEPSFANLRYLEQNISFMPIKLKSIVKIINKGVGSVNEKLEFYIDPITGQNNSFVKNFEGFYNNRRFQVEKNAVLEKTIVDVIRLDDYIINNRIVPDFIKIDVEGFEWEVIKGFSQSIIKYKPTLMVEIQKDSLTIINFFKSNNYIIFNDKKEEIIDFDTYNNIRTPNIFFIPEK